MLAEMGWFSVVMTIGVLMWGTIDGMVMLVMIGFGGFILGGSVCDCRLC